MLVPYPSTSEQPRNVEPARQRSRSITLLLMGCIASKKIVGRRFLPFEFRQVEFDVSIVRAGLRG
jgi:hypothetical protein